MMRGEGNEILSKNEIYRLAALRIWGLKRKILTLC